MVLTNTTCSLEGLCASLANETGAGYCAEAPDPTDGGTLKVAHTLLGLIEKGDDAEPIAKAEFLELCDRAIKWATRN
jgi:hypothetical protein